jgi:hypothetical protein
LHELYTLCGSSGFVVRTWWVSWHCRLKLIKGNYLNEIGHFGTSLLVLPGFGLRTYSDDSTGDAHGTLSLGTICLLAFAAPPLTIIAMGPGANLERAAAGEGIHRPRVKGCHDGVSLREVARGRVAWQAVEGERLLPALPLALVESSRVEKKEMIRFGFA